MTGKYKYERVSLLTGKYKYYEDKAMAALQEYVDKTYGQHYVGDGGVQTIDFWQSLGSLETTARDTAIKYLARYGKKGGKNRNDILKTMHYCILMLYALDREREQAEHDYEMSLSKAIKDGVIHN